MGEMSKDCAQKVSSEILAELGDEYIADTGVGATSHHWQVFVHNSGMRVTLRITPYGHEDKFYFGVQCPPNIFGESMRFSDWGEVGVGSVYISVKKPIPQVVKELRSRLLDVALPAIKRIEEKRNEMLGSRRKAEHSFTRVVQCMSGKHEESEARISSLEESTFLDNEIHVRIRLGGSYRLEVDCLMEAEVIRIIQYLKNCRDNGGKHEL